MEMSKEEIVRKYKEARYKKGYIQILADLNGVDKSVIRKILIDAGITLPGNPNFGTPTAKIKKQIRKEEDMASLTETEEIIHDDSLKNNEEKKISLPKEIRKILEEDLEAIQVKMEALTDKRDAIETFLKEND